MFDNLKNKITGKKEEKKDGKYEEMVRFPITS
jgi:hypothetical protein